MVEVELASDSLGLLLHGEDSVEGVLAQDGHLPLAVVEVVLAQQLHDLAAHRRLHGAGGIKATSVEKSGVNSGYSVACSSGFHTQKCMFYSLFGQHGGNSRCL